MAPARKFAKSKLSKPKKFSYKIVEIVEIS